MVPHLTEYIELLIFMETHLTEYIGLLRYYQISILVHIVLLILYYGIIMVLWYYIVLWYYGIIWYHMVLWYYDIMVFLLLYKLFASRGRRFAGIHFQNLFLKKCTLYKTIRVSKSIYIV